MINLGRAGFLGLCFMRFVTIQMYLDTFYYGNILDWVWFMKHCLGDAFNRVLSWTSVKRSKHVFCCVNKDSSVDKCRRIHNQIFLISMSETRSGWFCHRTSPASCTWLSSHFRKNDSLSKKSSFKRFDFLLQRVLLGITENISVGFYWAIKFLSIFILNLLKWKLTWFQWSKIIV